VLAYSKFAIPTDNCLCVEPAKMFFVRCCCAFSRYPTMRRSSLCWTLTLRAALLVAKETRVPLASPVLDSPKISTRASRFLRNPQSSPPNPPPSWASKAGYHGSGKLRSFLRARPPFVFLNVEKLVIPVVKEHSSLFFPRPRRPKWPLSQRRTWAFPLTIPLHTFPFRQTREDTPCLEEVENPSRFLQVISPYS